MLLNDTMALKVAVPRGSRATAYCSFDGKGRIELRQGDYVTIAASRYPFPTVEAVRGRGAGLEWIESVSRTLRWNTREAKQKGWGEETSVPGRRRNSTPRVGAVPEEESGAGHEEVEGEGGEWSEAEGEGEGEAYEEGVRQEQDFDIDFDQDESEVGSIRDDSGYGTESPHRRNTLI